LPRENLSGKGDGFTRLASWPVFTLLFSQQLRGLGLLLAGIISRLRQGKTQMLLTVQECVDMSELSNQTIRAIAEHEHIPEVVAAELGHALLKSNGGTAKIRRILEENVELAVQAGQQDTIDDRKRVLERFIASYCK
jgi:hypothetical protein